MANLEGLSVAELREFLSRQVSKVRRLRNLLVVLIALVVLAIIAHVIYYYNSLTAMQYDVVNARAKVASVVQYRANLVPVLVESVASFVEHEDDVFNRAVDARERSLTAAQQASAELRKAAKEPLEEALQKIMAIAEQYPDLKTSEPFQLLMKQVTEAEAEIMKRRLEYNDKANAYTTATVMFPGNVYTALFRFPSFPYFQESQQSEWPQVRVQVQRETGR